MTNKKLKSIIKSKCDNVSVNDYSDSILLKVKEITPTKSYVLNRNRRVVFPALLASCLSIVAASSVILSATLIKDNGRYIKDVTISQELLSYEMVALGNVVPNENVSQIKRLAMEYSESEAIELSNEIHDHLITGEMMFNKDNFTAVHEINTNTEYDYQYKLTVEYASLEYASNYVMYYDEVKKIESNKELEEVNTYLNGIMIVDNEEFVVKGEKEVEKEEYETTLKIFTSPESYIEISHSTEINENEYKYEYVEEGVLVKEMSLEYEESLMNKELEINIKEDFVEKEFNFKFKKDYILCEYVEETESDIESEANEIMIELYETYYLYVFSEEIKIKKEK